MSYDEAVQFLYSLRLFGAKFGLENTRRLAELAGHPEQHLRFIHVAGTNGKGSTCAFLENIYRQAGFRVGLFTSPHLVSFRERIQVNRGLIPSSDVIRLVEALKILLVRGWGPPPGPEGPLSSTPFSSTGAAGENEQASHPTFFEVLTILALMYFAEQKCELVIWETGMGGRLDATNIVTPLASIITNIAFDHEKWLGHTLDSIAAEKAGIIKPGVPVITGTEVEAGLPVIQAEARRNNSPLTVVPGTAVEALEASVRPIALLGTHQQHNAALAVAAVRALESIFPVSEEMIPRGLEQVEWPGRLQIIKRGTQTVLLDGAHNPAGAGSLRQALLQYFPDRERTFVLGALADKAWPRICQILAPLARRAFLVPVQSERTARPEDLLPAFRQVNPIADIKVCANLSEALEGSAHDEFLVVTGSLYLVGETLERLKVVAAPATDERGLNEWTAPTIPRTGPAAP